MNDWAEELNEVRKNNPQLFNAICQIIGYRLAGHTYKRAFQYVLGEPIANLLCAGNGRFQNILKTSNSELSKEFIELSKNEYEICLKRFYNSLNLRPDFIEEDKTDK